MGVGVAAVRLASDGGGILAAWKRRVPSATPRRGVGGLAGRGAGLAGRGADEASRGAGLGIMAG